MDTIRTEATKDAANQADARAALCPDSSRMGEPTPKEVALRDPLSHVTRNERRLLLGVSMVGITLVKTGLVPEKISTLGIEFTKTNQKSLLAIISFVTIYFLFAFAIYAAADFIAWRLAFHNALSSWITNSYLQAKMVD